MSSRPQYSVLIKRSAEREMDALPSDVFERTAEAIQSLESTPRPRGCKKLRGRSAYRYRVGDYRILYTIDDSSRTIEVFAVRHRREAYR